MRLSSDPTVDRSRALATIHAALDAGATWLDTADVYAPNEGEIGHNERLVREALAAWVGDRARVRVSTKGGLVREGGRWRPDGRARHLAAACEASLRALGVAAIDLYYLHAPDPRVSLSTSVRALLALSRAGLVRSIGLSNVNVEQIEEASRLAPIAAVQVRAGPGRDEAIRSGVASLCRARGIDWFSHTPLGGAGATGRLGREPALAAVAARHAVTPAEAALAHLVDLGAIPLVGATRPETVRSAATAVAIALGEADRRELAPGPIPTISSSHEAEVVMIVGGPAAGKTTAARELVARGYARLNRDDRGGRLDDLAPELEGLLAGGAAAVVLDNTYSTRASRSRVVDVARRHGARVSCIWIDTPIELAQTNACVRLIERHGSLPTPEEMAARVRTDPVYLGPGALFRARRGFETPRTDEGFASIERRVSTPCPVFGARAAVLLEADAIRTSRSGARAPLSPDDVELLPGRAERLARAVAEGALLLGTAWAPEVGGDPARAERFAAALDRTNERLGVAVTWLTCPHPPGPPICWCRRPLPGLGVALLRAHDADPRRSVCVGRGAADEGFARRLGVEYVDHAVYFA